MEYKHEFQYQFYLQFSLDLEFIIRLMKEK
jgi:hypothetical protein